MHPLPWALSSPANLGLREPPDSPTQILDLSPSEALLRLASCNFLLLDIPIPISVQSEGWFAAWPPLSVREGPVLLPGSPRGLTEGHLSSVPLHRKICCMRFVLMLV